MISSEYVGRKYFKNYALFTATASLVTALICHPVPDFPFDRLIIPVLFVTSAVYFAVFVFFEYCDKHLQTVIQALSLFSVGVLAVLTHFTGGVVSPLTCLYFAILMSEVAYGVTFTVTIYAALASYLGVVLGEAFGFLEVKAELAKTIYEHPAVFIAVVATVACHMVITGRIARLVIIKLKLKVEEMTRKKQAILNKFVELDSYAHIGLLSHRIVHDLRGPLATLSGYIELERLSPDKTAEEKAVLSDLAETVVKMAETLSSVTRLGRISGGEKEKINIKDFFRNLFSTLVFYKDAQRIQFRQQYPDADDLSIVAVRQDLQQAYFNILKNAVEAVANNTGDKIIGISVRQSGRALQVDIVNNGRHIPEAIIVKIFRTAVTGKTDGTGVGLLICHDLLARNDVKIEISNTEGAGVCVSTRMKLAD
ncbi:MAG: HAMP domain-containing sensor histidine kinase [Elusimicrobiota bacterium]